MTRLYEPRSHFSSWKLAVDGLMESRYAITIDDAGISDQEFNVHWEARESPNEFVSWFATKYDLEPADSAHPYFPRSIP